MSSSGAWQIDPVLTGRMALQLGLPVTEPFTRAADWPADLGIGIATATFRRSPILAVATGGATDRFLGPWNDLGFLRSTAASFKLVFGARVLDFVGALIRSEVGTGWTRVVTLDDERAIFGAAARLATLLGTVRAILDAHADAATEPRIARSMPLARAAAGEPLVRPAALTIGDALIDGHTTGAFSLALQRDEAVPYPTLIAARHTRKQRGPAVPDALAEPFATDPCLVTARGATLELTWCLREGHLPRPVLLRHIATALAWHNRRDPSPIYR